MIDVVFYVEGWEVVETFADVEWWRENPCGSLDIVEGDGGVVLATFAPGHWAFVRVSEDE